MASVTVRAEWDMGHRLPNHGGACRNLHGHRYVADLTVRGPVKAEVGAQDEGMVADFKVVKDALRRETQKLDHRFLVSMRDPLAEALQNLPGVQLVPYVPTGENIALDVLQAVRAQLRSAAPLLVVERLRLYETPTSWADVGGPE